MKQISISGIIGWDATAQQLREALAAANGEAVELVISSPGGFVGEGLEMYNLVRNYPGATTARLSGYAMSMASYIPLAADRIVAEDNAIYMIHNVRGGVWGDHNDILKYGEMTKAMSRMLARAYVARSGKSAEEIAAMMDRETYLFGEDMVAEGFADEIIGATSEEDRETATALARMAMDECSNRMAADVAAVKADLTKAAALAGRINQQPRATATAKPADKGARTMLTLTQLRAEHSELVAAIEAEARQGMITTEELQAQLATAKADGAAAENQRIKDVRAQLIPGHEALIEALAADGKTSGAEAALAIVGAEKALRNQALAAIEGEAPPAAPHAEGGDGGKTMKRAAFNALSQADRRAFNASGGKIID